MILPPNFLYHDETAARPARCAPPGGGSFLTVKGLSQPVYQFIGRRAVLPLISHSPVEHSGNNRLQAQAGIRQVIFPYSTRGGTSGYTVRMSSPSVSISLRFAVNTF